MSSTGATPPLGSESIGPTLKMTAKYLNRPNERDFVTSTMTAGQTLPAATPASQPKVIFREGSLRRNFSWTLVGNIVYSACQWGILVILAKLGNPEMVGQYGLAIAIATPVLALSSLQLRQVLTTDVKETVAFGEYLGFRLITTVLSLFVN